MSKIKVNSLEGVGASTPAISIDNASGTCTANLSNRQGKNLVVNGACLIAQRGSSSTSSGYHTVDRFKVQHSGADEAPTQSQADVASGTTPYSLGFRKCLKITNGNQTSVSTSDYMWIQYFIEAQDIANSGWNYTSASSFITLSFWVKSSVAQDFKGYLKTADGSTYNYPFATGSLTADTWTKITKTIPGNSNLQFDNNNQTGLEINILPYLTTSYTDNSVTENAWATFGSGTRAKDTPSDWWSADNATFEITGLQLEVSDHSTDFEHRSYADELRRCQRYYAKYQATGSAYAQFLVTTGYSTDTDSRGIFNFIVEMRAANPSFTYSGSSGNVDHFQDLSGKAINLFQLADSGGTGKNTGIRCIFSGVNTSAGFSHAIRAANNTNAFFAFDAEL